MVIPGDVLGPAGGGKEPTGCFLGVGQVRAKRTARATAGAEATVRLGVIEHALDEAWFNGDQFCNVTEKMERANRFCSNNGWPRVGHEKDMTIVCSCISLVHVTYTGGVYMYMHLYVQL